MTNEATENTSGYERWIDEDRTAPVRVDVRTETVSSRPSEVEGVDIELIDFEVINANVGDVRKYGADLADIMRLACMTFGGGRDLTIEVRPATPEEIADRDEE